MADLLLVGGVEKNATPKQWTYRLTVTDDKGKSVEISYPATIEFNVVRNTFAQSNTGHFSITNLNATTRSHCFKDLLATGLIKTVKFEAGYEGNLSTVFNGCILECYPKRNGTEIVTEMQAWDIVMESDTIAMTFQAGTDKREAYKIVCNKANIPIGNIGSLEGKFEQETVLIGKPLEVLNKITGNNTFIDNNVANTLMNDECIKGEVQVLNAETGLLGTPQRRNAQVIIESIFRPEYKVGQLIEVQSSTSSDFSGTYVVVGLEHSGIISSTTAGKRITRLNLINGKSLSSANVNITGQTQNPTLKIVEGEKVTPVNAKYGSSVREVYRYIQENKGDVSRIDSKIKKITELISWKDMLQPSGSKNTNSQIFSQITEEYLENCRQIAIKLTNFLNGSSLKGKKINIISGWRSKENNASLKNASNESVHLRGGAIDFNIRGVSSQKAFWSIFYPNWDRFTYLYRVDNTSTYNIHVQNTFGKENAKRLKNQ